MLSQTPSAIWKRKNKEHVKAKLKAWPEANKERRSKYHSDRWRENKEELSRRKAARYYLPKNVEKRERDKEKIKKQNKEWRKKHPHYASQRCRELRALRLKTPLGKRKLIDNWENNWRQKLEVKCYWCLDFFHPKGCHVDHVIAMKRGGPHEIGNLCIACADCNLRKQGKTLARWNSQIEQPVLF